MQNLPSCSDCQFRDEALELRPLISGYEFESTSSWGYLAEAYSQKVPEVAGGFSSLTFITELSYADGRNPKQPPGVYKIL